MKIINELEALAPLRRAREAHKAGAEHRLERVFQGTIPAVKKFADDIGEKSDVLMFVGSEHCWFFSKHLAIRSTIHAPDEPSELICYIPARDFGPITIIKEGDGTLSVSIASDSTGPIKLEATAIDENVTVLETALQFLLGHAGPARTANQEA